MDYSVLIEFLIVFGFAATKFAMAAGYMLLPTVDFSYLEIVVTLILGGFSGVLVFYFFSTALNKLLAKIFPSKKKTRIFTKGRRRFVSIKNKYGLWGISALTPILLSIPVGCFLASKFYRKRKDTLPVMFAGILFWSFVLPLIKKLY